VDKPITIQIWQYNQIYQVGQAWLQAVVTLIGKHEIHLV
jgi:hypothetical protein